MVLYHWMNYFLKVDPSVYRFLRFLTPSFIFIAGYLVSQVYLAKYLGGDPHPPRRLRSRGIKLLGIVAVLNLLIDGARAKGPSQPSYHAFSIQAGISYVLGFQPIAFSVLVPIAYVLLLSALLVPTAKRHAYIFYEICAIALSCCVALESLRFKTGYLDLVAIGLLGICVGNIPLARINAALQHPLVIGGCYLLYLCAIIRWNVIYALQIFAVCINVAVLYWLGLKIGMRPVFGQTIVRLGKYSLFAYILQILLLQLLQKLLPSDNVSVCVAALAAAASGTILCVELIDRGRQRISVLNRYYSAIFS